VPERFRSIELAPDLVQAYARTFIPRWDDFHLQLPNGIFFPMHRPLTNTDIFKHLTEFHAGRKPYTIAGYFLNEKNQGNKLRLDANTPQLWQALLQMAQHLERESIPVYLELSASGGHLWLFTPPLSGTVLRQFGQHLLKEYKIPIVDEAGKQGKIGLYPKQTAIEVGHPDSFVALPLGMDAETHQAYPFITADGQPIGSSWQEQIAVLALPKRVTQDYIDKVLSPISKIDPKSNPPLSPTEAHAPAYGQREFLSERLKREFPVYEFVQHYVALDHNARGFCPFHHDQKQSFQVNRRDNYWHCHAGCKGNTIIDFWMLWRTKSGQDGSFKKTILDLRDMLLK
jgi:hypothetical protein